MPLVRQIREVSMHKINGERLSGERDFLAVEEPLEIRVEGRSIAVVMRTPGDDRELAAGFLVTEGLVRSAEDILNIQHEPQCPQERLKDRFGQGVDGNIINVTLKYPDAVDLGRLTRHVFTSSSCGICSKASIQAVRQQFPVIEDDCRIAADVLMKLPGQLDAVQESFKWTGGLHACALFDVTGQMILVREDVGRHNALDKIIGWALLSNRLPLRRHVLLLSGRTSFEMLQKALAGGISIIAAISAPSSLAVQFAQDSGQSLVGFLRGARMNIYAGSSRIG
jgi:FdhD protein